VNQADLIWLNGEFVAWEDAKVHVLTHGLHYGTGVFEGIRCYETEHGPAVFRHRDHLDRLERSARLYYMPMPYSGEQLREVTHELIARNGLRSCYIRPLVYRGYGQLGLNPLDLPVEVAIALWEWGAYLGEESKLSGIRAKVSSWRRISPDSLIPHAKASGQYLNSVLAKVESVKAGYDEAILLDDHGHVCEGSGENIYVVRDGQIVTPPQTASILDGINRKSIIVIARDLGYEVVERDLARAELYLADEVFLSGTAAELVPVREIDDHAIGGGEPGEITRVLQGAFEDALHGRTDRYHEWLDLVDVAAAAPSDGSPVGPPATADVLRAGRITGAAG
jgi:branched-chain amino acid aminotransferase